MTEEIQTERSLLEKFLEISRKREAIALALKAVNKEFRESGLKLIEMLNAHDKSETATYEGLGYALLAKPRLQASCSQENKERLMDYLRSVGREDLIKTDVNSMTLSSFVREVMENEDTLGVPLPEYININYIPNIQLRDERGKMISSFSNKPNTEEE